MGELPSGDGQTGPRRAHPGGPGPEPGRRPGAGDGLEALLAVALRADGVDEVAERRAVRAFRDARSAGAHEAARTRRRDDWRPRGPLGGRSLRTTLAVLLAGFTLGGVAFAAIGGVDSASRGAGDGSRPGGTSPDARPGGRGPGSSVSSSPSASAAGRSGPEAAREAEERCRAYERAGGNAGSLTETVRRRLADAAGGEERIDGYCDRALRRSGGREDGGREGAADTPPVPDLPTATAAPDVTVPVPTGAPVNPPAAPPAPPALPDGDRDQGGGAADDGLTGTFPDLVSGQDRERDRLDIGADVAEQDPVAGTRE